MKLISTLIIILFLSCSSNKTTRGALIIEGYITSYETEQPIEGVKIIHKTNQVYSDENGFFSMEIKYQSEHKETIYFLHKDYRPANRKYFLPKTNIKMTLKTN